MLGHPAHHTLDYVWVEALEQITASIAFDLAVINADGNDLDALQAQKSKFLANLQAVTDANSDSR
jgi:hypothetical protein